MSNLGKWDQWYAGLDINEPEAYGDITTYEIAAEYLDGLDIEDWGCGKGYFRIVHRGGYVGIDGSQTPFADKIVDLCSFRTVTEGILLRHVLEHNDGWQDILVNALTSATRRICLILFTPMADKTHEIARPADIGVPDIAFSHDDLAALLMEHDWWATWRDLHTNTQYGTERVYFMEKA